jgi:AcrR family transcriptional regulator
MKNIIRSKAIDLFLKFGFKSVTMEDIAYEMCISKKTIYKYFCSKKILIEEGTATVHKAVRESIDTIVAKNHNAIEENFEIRKIFKKMFIAIDSSPIYQLKKEYPEIYNALISREVHECKILFKQNIEKGIQQELYRKELNIENYVSFYYTLVFSVCGNISSEKELNRLELEALEYHTKAMATPKGVVELEKQIQHFNI